MLPLLFVALKRGLHRMAEYTADELSSKPYISADKKLPEVTVKAVVLGIFLAILLAASSTYMGLKIARTIAGSIPAALVSMMVLRRFKNSNILENNMVQTIASAGEVVAAGVIFTLPALIIMGYWQSFDYFQTMIITVLGAVLGIFFSVPLRRSMVVKEHMPFPEGLATAEVLIAGEDTQGGTKELIVGSVLAAFISFLQSGLKIASEQLQFWTKVGSTGIGVSLMLSPVMMAAGYIVGLAGLLSFIVGGLFTWLIGIPLFGLWQGLPEAPDLGTSLALIQKNNFRFMGVGILAIGGIWSVLSLMKQIVSAVTTSFAAMKKKGGEFATLKRTDRDIPFRYVIWGILGISIPIFILFFKLLEPANLGLNSLSFYGIVLFATLFSLIIGFICAAIAAYIVGIVGTTSMPISGITIVAIISFSSLLLFFLKGQIDFVINKEAALQVSATVIAFAAIMCLSASVSGDNMQDLKAGYMVGATPWKQQTMLLVGSIASALVIPFILQTTYEAYGIGDILPRPGMDPKQALLAPQATLMATITSGLFSGKMPWNMIQIGVLFGFFAIILDEYLKRTGSKFRFPPLLLALGFYFPFSYVTAFTVGGIIHALVHRQIKARDKALHANHGILFASGIIAGEAILGAILTIPFAIYKSTDILALNLPALAPLYPWIGALLYFTLCVLLYKKALAKKL